MFTFLICLVFGILIGWNISLSLKLNSLESNYDYVFDSILSLAVELKEQENFIDQVNYFANLNHSEYLDHLYKSTHLVERDGRLFPIKPAWSTEEEFEIRKFIQMMKEEGIKRGIIQNNSLSEDQS